MLTCRKASEESYMPAMHQFKILILSLLFIAGIANTAAAAAAVMPNDIEIQVLFDSLATNLNRQDLNRLVNLWSYNGEIITLAGGIYHGQNEIRNLFIDNFSG